MVNHVYRESINRNAADGLWTEHVDLNSIQSTPAVILDEVTATRNISRWADSISKAGVSCRPHIKGHKTVELAKAQLRAGAVGFEVSRLREIKFLINSGIDVEFVLSWIHYKPRMWDDVARLNAKGHRIIVDVDSIDLLKGYQQAAQRHATIIPVRIQVDSGLRGCTTTSMLEMCSFAAVDKNIELWGLTAYRSFYNRDESRNWTPFDVIGRQEAAFLASCREQITETLKIDTLKILCGSTATTGGSLAIDGVTEVTGGSYVLNDWGLAQMGVCNVAEIAVAVVATVMQANPDGIKIDAGSEIFGRWDPYPGIDHPVSASTADGILGFVAVNGQESHSNDQSYVKREIKAGDRLIVFPSHVSELVNLPGHFFVRDEEGIGPEQWQRLSTGLYDPEDAII